MEVTFIFLVFTVFMCGLLTGYLVGSRERKPGYIKQQSALSDKVLLDDRSEICLHETAVVRTDGSSVENSLLVCEKCGADYGNFATSLENRLFRRTKN